MTWSIERFRAIEPERPETIARVAGAAPILAAAFDGPLRSGFDVIRHYRSAERMLTKRLGRLIGKPGQASTPVGISLNQNANQCASAVLKFVNVTASNRAINIDAKAIVEAFPSSFLGMMIEQPLGRLLVRRGNRSDIFYTFLVQTNLLRRLICNCLPGRTLLTDLSIVTNHDDRAALVCAITGLCFAAGTFVAVGDYNGWIILPPLSFIRPWAVDALQENNAEEPNALLHIEGDIPWQRK